MIGYHGTDRSAAINITKTQNFKISNKKNEWLGKGVYFYELLEKASWWASNNKDSVVLKTPINVEHDKLVDLDLPSEEDKFGKFIREMEKSGTYIFDKDEVRRRCQLINIYMEYIDSHVTVATLPSTNPKYKNEFNQIGYIRTEKQICVHNTDCIVYNEIEEIEIEG